MDVKKYNILLSKICITIILVALLWQYGFSSYLSKYDYIFNTGEVVEHSIPMIDMITRITTLLAYISCIWLFINKFWKQRLVNLFELIYITIVLAMLCVLFFVTKDFWEILFDLGEWSNRMGIITVIGCSIYFYAYETVYWDYLKKLISMLVLVIAILLTVILLTQPEIYAHRVFAYKWLHGFGVMVRLGIWFFVANNRKYRVLNIYVLLVDLVMLVCLQTRLYFIDFVLQMLLMCILLIKNKKQIKNQSAAKEIKKIGIMGLVGISALVIAVFIPNTSIVKVLPQNIQSSLEMFSGRVYDDTRTEQAEGFFEYFWDSFPIGVGYNTEGIPTGVGEEGIDCGYLNTMYITGLPMVILLILFTIVPIYACWSRKLAIEQIVVVSRATTWTVILLSSASTGFEIEFIFFVLCAGRCAGLLFEKGGKEGNEKKYLVDM